jgi:hypothetical protein
MFNPLKKRDSKNARLVIPPFSLKSPYSRRALAVFA